MTILRYSLPPWVRAHWFYLAAALVLVSDILIANFEDGPKYRLLEMGVMLDQIVIMPLLYWFCYRVRGKQVMVRTLAIACLGFWIAGKIVPLEQQSLLIELAPLRYVGLGVLVLIELKLMVMLYRAFFTSEKSSEAIAAKLVADAGMPPWAAKLMAWEARFWKRVWNAVKRLLRKP
jgi:hypothetical protein